jgi:hypothetical protein
MSDVPIMSELDLRCVISALTSHVRTCRKAAEAPGSGPRAAAIMLAEAARAERLLANAIFAKLDDTWQAERKCQCLT